MRRTLEQLVAQTDWPLFRQQMSIFNELLAQGWLPYKEQDALLGLRNLLDAFGDAAEEPTQKGDTALGMLKDWRLSTEPGQNEAASLSPEQRLPWRATAMPGSYGGVDVALQNHQGDTIDIMMEINNGNVTIAPRRPGENDPDCLVTVAADGVYVQPHSTLGSGFVATIRYDDVGAEVLDAGAEVPERFVEAPPTNPAPS
jgi:hypothetical protein